MYVRNFSYKHTNLNTSRVTVAGFAGAIRMAAVRQNDGSSNGYAAIRESLLSLGQTTTSKRCVG
jgi:hypothetical protein